MSEHNIKKLKYPRWYNITFAILTVAIPICLFLYECLSAANTEGNVVFKITFVAIIMLIVTWYFLNQFVIKKFKTKILAEQVMLQHDYQAEIGNPKSIETVWYTNEKWLTLFDVIGVLLYGGLGAVILTAVQTGVIKIRGILVIIAACYVIAYTIKFILLMNVKEADKVEETNKPTGENTKENNTKANS